MIHSALEYINHLWYGRSIYRMHSPFVYEFMRTVLGDDRNYYAFTAIELRRKQLLRRKETVRHTDLGAGSRTRSSESQSIASHCRRSSVNRKFGRMLFRTVRHFGPRYVIELGSSVGIGSLYLASAMDTGRFISIEGDPVRADTARESLSRFPLPLPDWEIRTGNFEDLLTRAVADLPKVDLAYIDGNHREEPTVSYFKTLLGKCHEDSVLIFDDIHWSKEMTRAWDTVRRHPDVHLSLDLYRMGMLFFREANREAEHFRLYC